MFRCEVCLDKALLHSMVCHTQAGSACAVLMCVCIGQFDSAVVKAGFTVECKTDCFASADATVSHSGRHLLSEFSRSVTASLPASLYKVNAEVMHSYGSVPCLLLRPLDSVAAVMTVRAWNKRYM